MVFVTVYAVYWSYTKKKYYEFIFKKTHKLVCMLLNMYINDYIISFQVIKLISIKVSIYILCTTCFYLTTNKKIKYAISMGESFYDFA